MPVAKNTQSKKADFEIPHENRIPSLDEIIGNLEEDIFEYPHGNRSPSLDQIIGNPETVGSVAAQPKHNGELPFSMYRP